MNLNSQKQIFISLNLRLILLNLRHFKLCLIEYIIFYSIRSEQFIQQNERTKSVKRRNNSILYILNNKIFI